MNEVERIFSENRDYLWGHCYRMLGVAADADDVVQETFVRALEKPPADRARPWRPWLLTVASRLAIDQLRRRRRRAWVGPWLPEPIELGELAEARVDAVQLAEAEQADSLSYAFLLALEALTPQQRAVLLLRDVQELSGAETAVALGIGEANVKVVLHRARKALAAARGNSPFLDAGQKNAGSAKSSSACWPPSPPATSGRSKRPSPPTSAPFRMATAATTPPGSRLPAAPRSPLSWPSCGRRRTKESATRSGSATASRPCTSNGGIRGSASRRAWSSWSTQMPKGRCARFIPCWHRRS